MDFSAYWKEASVVLAALFTIAGAVFEVRDKRSSRITGWGRVFFSLTILSMIAGFYAQWLDNSNELKKGQEAQANMLKLITDTNKNVYNIARLLEPLGKSRISVFFDVDCDKVKEFCASARAEGEKIAGTYKITGKSSFEIEDVDWNKWPSGSYEEGLILFVFKNDADVKKMIDSNCLHCDWMGDLHFDLYTTGKPENENVAKSAIFYDTKSKRISLLVSKKDAKPKVHNENVMSMIDVPGSTVVLVASDNLRNYCMPHEMFVENERGEEFTLKDPKVAMLATGERYFTYRVPK